MRKKKSGEAGGKLKAFGDNVGGKAKALGSNLKKFWREPPSGRFLNLKEVLSLGTASLGVSFICNLISMYVTVSQIPIIYDMGKNGTLHATLMYLIASTLALFLTPVYGRMIQRTKTKIGRYKPYILCLAPVVGLLGLLSVWSPQSLGVTERTIYVYMVCTPTILVWNLWFNTYNMFPGVFTPNQQERADIWSPIGLVMGFAPTVMGAVKGLIVKAVGDIWAARTFGIFCIVIGMCCIVALLRVKERVYVTAEEDKKEKISTIEGLKMIVKNKPLMIYTLALCLGCLKGTIDLSWELIGRVKYATNMGDAAAIFSGLGLIVGFAATPNMLFLPLLTRKFNNRTILLFWQGCNIAANLVCALIGFQNFPQGSWSPYVITLIRFVSVFNCLGSLQPLILSEIADYQQAKSGYRLEGFIQTFAYSLTAVVTQAAALIPALVQSAMGFNPANYQVVQGASNVLTPELISALDNYANVAIWMSVASSVLMFICLIFYDLSKKKHAEVVEQLKANAVNADDISKEEGSLNLLENVLGSNKNNSDEQNNETLTSTDVGDTDSDINAELAEQSEQNAEVAEATEQTEQNAEVAELAEQAEETAEVAELTEQSEQDTNATNAAVEAVSEDNDTDK